MDDSDKGENNTYRNERLENKNMQEEKCTLPENCLGFEPSVSTNTPPKSPYLGDVLRCDGQEVDLVSQALGCLHSGNVGVDQHSLDILFLESLNSLETKTNMASAGRMGATPVLLRDL